MRVYADPAFRDAFKAKAAGPTFIRRWNHHQPSRTARRTHWMRSAPWPRLQERG